MPEVPVGGLFGKGACEDGDGGRSAELLNGEYESRDLECKSQAYDLSSSADKIEFAQDVASFANSEFGGFLVIGLKTKNDGQGDRIVRVRPLPSVPKASRYRKVIDQWFSLRSRD